MKRFLGILTALLLLWLLAYALAFLNRTDPLVGGFTYTRWNVSERIAYPLFWPLYRVHRWLGGPRHGHDLP